MCEWWNASWCSIFSVLSLFKSMRWRHLLDIVARITTTLSSAPKISILGLKNIMDKVKDYSFLVNLPFSIFSFQVLIFIRRVARSIINAFKLSAIFRLFSTAKFTLIFALAMLLSRFSFLGAAADGWFILSYFVSFDFKYSSVGACEFVVYFAQDFSNSVNLMIIQKKWFYWWNNYTSNINLNTINKSCYLTMTFAS